jgi:hypothetical protein
VVPAVPMDADTAEALAFGFSQYCASGWPSTEKF